MTDETDWQMPDWQRLKGIAIRRKEAGDIEGAIENMKEAVKLTIGIENLTPRTLSMLNFLADLYLIAERPDQAEASIREALNYACDIYPIHYADNLLMLAAALTFKGEVRPALLAAEEALALYKSRFNGPVRRINEVEEKVEYLRARASCDA
jgi:tetratricopeptide (TPR) repeat protein